MAEAQDRSYWFDVSFKAEDDKDDPGFGSGGSFKFRYNGIWLTDEDLIRCADGFTQQITRALTIMRDKEIERAKEAAKPFWMKWLGA